MTVKERAEKTIKELAKRKERKNKALEVALAGMAIERNYKAKKRVNTMRG